MDGNVPQRAALDRLRQDWPFEQPPETPVVTARGIAEGWASIVHVARDAGGEGWEFFGKVPPKAEDRVSLALGEIAELDPSILPLADLLPGGRAWRRDAQGGWKRTGAQPVMEVPAFGVPAGATVLVSPAVLERGAPVLHASHLRSDPAWLFAASSERGGAIRSATLSEVLARDASVSELADLPPGWHASRASAGEKWVTYSEPEAKSIELPRGLPGSGTRAWLIASLVLAFLASGLPFEADARTVSYGWWKLLTGWIFVLRGETLVWLSAPLMLAAWICLGTRHRPSAVVLCVLALAAALPFIAGPTLTYGWGEHIRRLPQTPQIGYYVWLGAIVAALVGSLRLPSRAGT